MRTPVRRPIKGKATVAMATAVVLGLAMPGTAEAGEDDAWDMERAFEELDRLQAEVTLLSRLGDAQAALLAWNRVRADSGAAPLVLAKALCAEEALRLWCRALPSTFGAEGAMAADDANGKDGRR